MVRYEDLSDNGKIIFNDVDNEINKLLKESRTEVIKLLVAKYGVCL